MQFQSDNSSRGFTLLETLIVIVFIGISSAIAVPNWLAFIDVCRLNATQDEVYRAIRQAKIQATQQKLTWQTSFREKDGIVQWAVHAANVKATKANWNNLAPNVRIDPETTLQQSKGIRRIQFNYKGHVNGQLGRITLSSKHGGKAKRCIYASTLLGAMRTGKDHTKPKDGKHCY